MTDGIPTPARYFAILSLSAGTLLMLADASIAAVALPIIADALHVSESRAVLVVTLYQLVLAMTIIPFSALGDHIGQRRLYMAALVVFALSASLCLLAKSLPILLAIRTVQALSAAAVLSVTFGLIRTVYPARQLGRGLGLNTLSAATGNALAPVIGGLILSAASWQWIFVVGVPFVLVALLAGRSLPNTRFEKQRFDIVGAALCAATFALIILGLESLRDSGGRMTAALLVGAGIVVGYVFVRHERRQNDPVLPLDLLASPAFALAIVASLAGVIASSTILISLPFRLHEYGFGPAEMGAMIAPYAVASIMLGPASGMLTDRVSPRVLGACGLVVAIAALLLIAFLPADVGYVDVAWRVWLCGAGFALFLAPNARIVISSAPANRTAASGSLVTTARMLGQTLSATLVGGLLAVGLGRGPAPAFIGVGLLVVSALSIVLRPRS